MPRGRCDCCFAPLVEGVCTDDPTHEQVPDDFYDQFRHSDFWELMMTMLVTPAMVMLLAMEGEYL